MLSAYFVWLNLYCCDKKENFNQYIYIDDYNLNLRLIVLLPRFFIIEIGIPPFQVPPPPPKLHVPLPVFIANIFADFLLQTSFAHC